MRFVAALSLVALVACSGPSTTSQPPQEPVPAALIADLDAQIPTLLAAARVPGLSIALVRDGQIAWSKSYGVKSVVTNAPVDDQTLFEVGSISKTVFAYAVIKLSEKDVIDLDTPLITYIDDRWLPDHTGFDAITARHVLSHTSGLPNWRSPEEPLRINFTPGSQWLYSGEAYSYLQLVVAHLTGNVDPEACETMSDGLRVCATEIDDYLKSALLVPFGMTSSGYVWVTPSEHAAAGHDKDGKPTNRPGATPIMAARYGAAGGLSTTATEYATFLIEVIDPKPADTYRVNRASHDEMLRPQVKVDDTRSWGLGWQIEKRARGSVISHSGDNPGFKASVVASPETRSGYVVLTNGDNGFEVINKLDPLLYDYIAR